MEKSFLKILQNLSFCVPRKRHTGLKVYTDNFRFVAKYSVIFKINQFHFVLSITIYNRVIQLLPRSADIAYILKCAAPCLKNVGLPYLVNPVPDV